MIRFLMKRVLFSIPLVFFLSFITLLLMQLVPGNYFDQLRMNPGIGADVIQKLEHTFHINENVFVQYWYWVQGVCRLDFGYSFSYHMPVTELIYSRLFNTFILSFSSLVLAWMIAIPLGVIAAYRKDSFYDRLANACSYVILSVPGYFVALLVVFICAERTNLPIGGMKSVYFDQLTWTAQVYDVFIHMLIPLSVLSIFTGSSLFRIVRANVLDVINKDFVRILYTRGIAPGRILFRHVLRNALSPLVTMLGFQIPALVSGAALIEIITGWPGLGWLMLQAVQSQDVFLVMGNMMMISFLLLVGTSVADLLLVFVDPRIRYSS